MLIGSIILGFSLMSLRWVDNLWQYYLLFGVFSSVGSMGLGETMTQVILPKWFIRKRGRALGIAVMGGGMGPLLAPVTLYSLMIFVGWRDTWFIMGLAVLVVLVPLSFLVKTRPEDIGLFPDGAQEPDASSADSRPQIRTPAEASNEHSLTRSEALKSPAFWLIVLAFGLGGLGQRGFQVNWLPYLQDLGFSTGVGALAIMVYGIFSVSVRPFWGILGDRFPVRSLIVAQSFLTASSVLILIYVSGLPMLLSFMILFGVTMGGSFILRPLLIANYFGRDHLGAIAGMMRPFQSFTGALGPIFVAAVYDLHGSYYWSFFLVMLGFATTGAVILLATPPKQRTP